MELEAIELCALPRSDANLSLDDKARELRFSEDRLKNAERLAHVGHWDWDIKFRQLSWSEECVDFWVCREITLPLTTDLSKPATARDRKRLEKWMMCLATKSGHSIEFRSPGATAMCESSTVLPRCHWIRKDCRCAYLEHVRTSPIPGAHNRRISQKEIGERGHAGRRLAHDFDDLLGAVLAQADLALATNSSGSYPNEELSAIRT